MGSPLRTSTLRNWLLLIAPAVLAACASVPAQPVRRVEASDRIASLAADNALAMVGRPYHYGGTTPRRGFDCSGLVQYSYRKAGLRLPRTTRQQLRASHRIRRSHLRRGDLVFFNLEGRRNSHVGIYLGRGRFVHAPSTGSRVRTDRLDEYYWRRHYSESRRFD